jgi:alpha-glucosidase
MDAQAVTVQPDLADLPVFVRAGSIIPRQNIVQHTGQTPEGPLELAIYPGQACAGSVYVDDGHSFAFREGQFFRQSFEFVGGFETGEFRLSPREGSYEPWWETIELTIYGTYERPIHVTAGRAAILGVTYDQARQALRVVLSDPAGEDVVTFRGTAND